MSAHTLSGTYFTGFGKQPLQECYATLKSKKALALQIARAQIREMKVREQETNMRFAKQLEQAKKVSEAITDEEYPYKTIHVLDAFENLGIIAMCNQPVVINGNIVVNHELRMDYAQFEPKTLGVGI